MSTLVALQGQQPDINPVGAYQNAQANATNIAGARQQQAIQNMNTVGALALGAMGGDRNGQADPQKWEEGLDYLVANGIPAEQLQRLRGRPELAPLIANASMSAIEQIRAAQTDQQIEQVAQQFQRSIFESDRNYGLQREQLAQRQAEANAPNYGFTNVDGTIIRTNSRDGTAEPVGTFGTPDAPELTPAQLAVDRDFASDYVEWRRGGQADSDKQLGQLQEALGTLNLAAEGQGDISGPLIGMTPDFIQAWVNPDAISTREAVQEVAQRNLKAILGAQFAQREGEQLISRAYNPSLEEAENIARVERLVRQMEAAAAAKEAAARYYEANGTLTGWNGRLPTMADMESALDGTVTNYGVQSNASGNTPGGVVDFSEYFR